MTAPESLAPLPRWYTPARLLAFFCLVLLLTWMDQGLFASNPVTGNDDAGNPLGVKRQFGLSGFQLGLLPALYTAGLCVASLAFAELAKHWNGFRLIGVGMALWAAGCVLTGAAQAYGMLVAARVVVGCGEAPLLTLTFTFVDDFAPPASKSLWFGVLGLFPVLGTAAGYVLADPLTAGLGWRGAFFLMAGLALPLVAFALLMPPVSLKAGGAAAVRSPATAGAGQRQQQLQQHQGLPSSGGLVGGVRGVSSPGGAAVWPLAELHLTEVHHRERPPAANPHRSTIDSTAGAAGALEHSASTLRVPLVAGFECSSSQRHADLLSLAHAGQPTAAGSGTLAAGEGTDPWDGGPAGITSGREGHARRRQEGAEKLLPAAGPDSVHVDSGVLGTGEGSGLLPGSGVATAGCRTSTGAWAGDGWLGKRDGVRAPGCMGRITTMLRDLKQVVVYPACVCNNVGYAPIQWIFGIVTFWGPKALQDVFRVTGSGPELVIGAITVITGVVGTLAGGWLLDRFGSSLRNGFLIQTVSVALALLCLQLAFCVTQSYAAFCVVLSLGMTAIFMAQAPSYALSMWTVPRQHRPLSQAVIILLQHVLGDVPSPPLTGALHDATRNWRKSFAIAMSYLGLAVLLYVAGLGLCVAGRARDFRDEEEEEEERGQSGECGDAVLVRPGVEDVKGRVGHRWAAAGAETEQAEPGRTSSLRQPLSGNAM